MSDLSRTSEKQMYTVEFADPDGPRIEHIFLTTEEFHKLLDEFHQRRVSFSIHRTSDVAAECCHDTTLDVLLNNDCPGRSVVDGAD
jgi:hypothetical protein